MNQRVAPVEVGSSSWIVVKEALEALDKVLRQRLLGDPHPRLLVEFRPPELRNGEERGGTLTIAVKPTDLWEHQRTITFTFRMTPFGAGIRVDVAAVISSDGEALPEVESHFSTILAGVLDEVLLAERIDEVLLVAQAEAIDVVATQEGVIWVELGTMEGRQDE